MANEKIEIGCWHIGTSVKVEYHRKFLPYTDKAGQRYIISGQTGGETSPQSPLGKIHVEAGLLDYMGLPYDTNNPDNSDNGETVWYKNADKEPISPRKQYRGLIAETPDLSVKQTEVVHSVQSKDNVYPYDYSW